MQTPSPASHTQNLKFAKRRTPRADGRGMVEVAVIGQQAAKGGVTMKRVIAFAAIMTVIAWCVPSVAALAPEVEEALALAAGKLPVEYLPRSATPGNSVVVESVTIPAGDTGTVGVYLTNDVPIRLFQIPLIIRSIDQGSYMTHLEGSYNEGSRLNSYINGEYYDTVIVVPIINYFTSYSSQHHYVYGYEPTGPDYVSPDGILFVRMRILPDNNLPPGSDGGPDDGTPMILMKFQVNDHPGRFEIDTCLIAPTNHIQFNHGAAPGEPGYRTVITPEFTKGIVTIEGEGDRNEPPDSVVVDIPEDTVVVDVPEDTAVVDIPEDTVVTDWPADTISTADTVIVVDDPPLDSFPVFGTPGDEDDIIESRDEKSPDVSESPVGNYPNPFNSSTTIRYSLDGSRRVAVVIYDLLGRTVATLVDQYQGPGDYLIPWDGRDAHGNAVPAGIYFYRVQKGDFKVMGKMVLLK